MQWSLAGVVLGRAVCVFAAVLLLTVGNARAQGSVAGDRAALEALYNATGGATWTNNTNWLSAMALSEWHGVSTDATGRVTNLYLTDNKLSGEIPSELANLAALVELSLWGNQLTGMIPAGVAPAQDRAALSTGVQKFNDVFSRAYAATAVRDSRASTRLRRRLRSRRVNFHWNGVAASW